MTDTKVQPKASPVLDKERRAMLFDEDKILQQKFDKIGDFQFRVKQWALTLFAALVGAQVTHPAWPSVLLGFCGVCMCFMFWWMEREQHQHGIKFRILTRQIENDLKTEIGFGPSISAILAKRIPAVSKKKKKAWERSAWQRWRMQAKIRCWCWRIPRLHFASGSTSF